MLPALSSEPDPDDLDAFRTRFFAPIDHRGRTVRVLVAMALTVPGFLPIPYAGLTCGIVLFAPAAVLLVFAGLDRRSRRGVVLCAVPTMLGLALSLYSVVILLGRSSSSVKLVMMALGTSVVTTLLAALVGSPPHAR